MADETLAPLSVSGFEVYETEKNDAKSTAVDSKDAREKIQKALETGDVSQLQEETEEEELTDSEKELNRYISNNGAIKETAYYSDSFNNGFDEDYEGISNNGSISFPEIDLSRFHKGKKICLKKANDTGTPLVWEDLKSCLVGFISEITFADDGVDLKLVGMTKLLDQEMQFEFTQTKRSEILKQMIEAAGLKANVNPAGLNDDVIDYSNTGGDSGGSGESTGSASLDEAVEKAIKGKKTPLEKAKAIDKAFKNHVFYKYYYDVHHPDLEEAWKNAHLNCADGANVLCAMFIKGKLKAVIVHVPNHYIVKLDIGGKTYYTDNAADDGKHTTRPFGEVWRGNTSGSVVGNRIPA